MQKNRPLSCPSLTKTDGSLHLVPGRLKAAHCSWGPGGRTVQDGKKQRLNSQTTSGLRVCVCVSCVASMYSRVCCSVSLVPLKSDNYTIISHVHVTHIMSYWSLTLACEWGSRNPWESYNWGTARLSLAFRDTDHHSCFLCVGCGLDLIQKQMTKGNR